MTDALFMLYVFWTDVTAAAAAVTAAVAVLLRVLLAFFFFFVLYQSLKFFLFGVDSDKKIAAIVTGWESQKQQNSTLVTP